MPFAADIVPLLTTLPPALVLPSTVTLPIWMPVPEVAVILPLLLTPPESVMTSLILMPVPCAAITLVLATTPVKVLPIARKMPGGDRSGVCDAAAGFAGAEDREPVVVDAGLRRQPSAVDNSAAKGGH
jgi:hypothetical protein